MIFKKKTRNMLKTFFAVGALLSSTFVPLKAEQTVQIHKWAIQTLVNGQKYGIFPLKWENTMQAEIKADELTQFVEKIGDKVEEIPGIKDQNEKVVTYSGKLTREVVLTAIYNELRDHSYPSSMGFEQSDALSFMQKAKIIVGDPKGLSLDKPCTLEEAAVFGTRMIDYIYSNLNEGAKGLFWKATNGENTVYMLGSLHFANYGIYPFNQKILQAYESADVLGVEISGYNQAGVNDFMERTTYKDGSTLKDHISEELYAKTMKAIEKVSLPKENLTTCKPWFIANNLISMAASGSKDIEEVQLASILGIDNYFLTRAFMEKKEIYELEGYGYQGQLFDSFSKELQNYYLDQAAEVVLSNEVSKQSSDNVDEWLNYWKKGDLDNFTTSYNKDSDPDLKEDYLKEYHDKLFTSRDKQMTQKIETLLTKEGKHTYFIVVGSGHYVGKDGVIALLKNKGYKVEQIK